MFRAGRFLVRALSLALAAGTFAVPLAAQRITRAADKAPPAIKVASPAHGARIDTFTPVIEIAYDDEGSGVAVVSFRVTINGRDHSVEFEHHSQGATGKIAASNPLPLGENKITVELADRSGNVGRAESTFLNAGGGWLNAIADPGVGSGRHIELVFDASGSMDDKMLDNTRMDVAKGSVKNLIKALPADTPLGLRVLYRLRRHHLADSDRQGRQSGVRRHRGAGSRRLAARRLWRRSSSRSTRSRSCRTCNA